MKSSFKRAASFCLALLLLLGLLPVRVFAITGAVHTPRTSAYPTTGGKLISAGKTVGYYLENAYIRFEIAANGKTMRTIPTRTKTAADNTGMSLLTAMAQKNACQRMRFTTKNGDSVGFYAEKFTLSADSLTVEYRLDPPGTADGVIRAACTFFLISLGRGTTSGEAHDPLLESRETDDDGRTWAVCENICIRAETDFNSLVCSYREVIDFINPASTGHSESGSLYADRREYVRSDLCSYTPVVINGGLEPVDLRDDDSYTEVFTDSFAADNFFVPLRSF